MSEEIQAEVPATEVPEGEQQETQAPELSAVEQKAIEMGWRPKEEFSGDEEDFIDATEFVRRKPLFEKIDSVGKELKETRKALKALQAHHEKVKEAEYQAALRQLRNEKKEALEAGDSDKLIEIDERLADAKAQQRVAEAQAQQQAAQPHPGFLAWVNKNQWYKEDAELQAAANQIGTAYAAANPDVDPDAVLKYTEGRIKKLYSDRFTNPNKSRPSAVEGRTSTPATKPVKDDLANYPLTEDERRTMNTFVRQGIMTKEAYIAEIKRLNGD